MDSNLLIRNKTIFKNDSSQFEKLLIVELWGFRSKRQKNSLSKKSDLH